MRRRQPPPIVPRRTCGEEAPAVAALPGPLLSGPGSSLPGVGAAAYFPIYRRVSVLVSGMIQGEQAVSSAPWPVRRGPAAAGPGSCWAQVPEAAAVGSSVLGAQDSDGHRVLPF